VSRKSAPTNVFATISQERAIQYGITNLPTQSQINTFQLSDLYEMAYGGSSSYFDSPVFAQYKAEEDAYLTDVTRGIKVEESIYICGNCGYNKVRVQAVQLRSGDEGQDVFYLCARCQHPWHRF
jgi:DNA-directed RNA polymerase subunit M/transcription elongation factor TFIIS